MRGVPIPPAEPLVPDAGGLVVEQQLRQHEEVLQVRLLDHRRARRDELVLHVAALPLERRVPRLRPAGSLGVVGEADREARDVDRRRILEGDVPALRVALRLAAHVVVEDGARHDVAAEEAGAVGLHRVEAVVLAVDGEVGGVRGKWWRWRSRWRRR